MAGLPRAEYYPVVGRILAAETGELLVERADLSEGSGKWNGPPGPTTWDLLSSGDSLTGRTTFPEGFQPRALRGSMVAGLMFDENDVPSIIAYRLR